MTSVDGRQAVRLVPIDRRGRVDAPGLPLPPDLLAACTATAALYDRMGHAPPWVGYLSLCDGRFVGGGAFVGPPREGQVEIAYFTRAGEEGLGVATATAAALVALVRAQDPALTITAKTAPSEGPSTRILKRLGFVRCGVAVDHEIGEAWLWRLPGPGGSAGPTPC